MICPQLTDSLEGLLVPKKPLFRLSQPLGLFSEKRPDPLQVGGGEGGQKVRTHWRETILSFSVSPGYSRKGNNRITDAGELFFPPIISDPEPEKTHPSFENPEVVYQPDTQVIIEFSFRFLKHTLRQVSDWDRLIHHCHDLVQNVHRYLCRLVGKYPDRLYPHYVHGYPVKFSAIAHLKPCRFLVSALRCVFCSRLLSNLKFFNYCQYITTTKLQ